MGKASKRKQERREQGNSTNAADNEKKIWELKWFQYSALVVLVLIVLVATVSLANYYAEDNGLPDNNGNGTETGDVDVEDITSELEDLDLDEILEMDADEEEPSDTDEGEKETTQEGESEVMDKPLVTIEMESGGIIKAELEPGVAPNTVKNFIHLIEDGFYDGLIFHRVIPGFMIQGGCPEGTGMGNPGYSIKGEFSSNGHENNLTHKRGILSMARSQNPDSAGSQFFIMHEDSSHLDGEYAAFGRVTEGMDEVDRIVSVPTGANDRPTTEQVIKKVTVETFGIKYEEPEKL